MLVLVGFVRELGLYIISLERNEKNVDRRIDYTHVHDVKNYNQTCVGGWLDMHVCVAKKYYLQMEDMHNVDNYYSLEQF